ncbi:UDP-2,3-diacylglucosamine diphosphatase [Rhodobacter ferrooxidans]|uniref:UDP-2,3-diacylglucosamine diphosphatase n=1 Tax=Rhodobacter ferrooxidans TaxID=371731 RepID=UPI000311605C|nr:UDP-2,3-diacylglucosamine diphosphatase [Rhodobacter sp. SW2]
MSLPPHTPVRPVRDHRSLFLSDLHLGSLSCRADLALAFLQANRAERYVLVGDILDLWRPMPAHWSQAAQGVIDHLAARQAEGAEVVYLLGNHDPHPDTVAHPRRIPAQALTEMVHHAADGRRFLVVHGDCQDHRLLRFHILTRLGTRLDHGLRLLDHWLGRLAWRAAPQRRSLIEALLSGLNAALYPTRGHERRLVQLARAGGYHGVICGHFHLAALHDDHGLIYANCGDWVDSFTALAEDFDGRLGLMGGRAALAPLPRPIYASNGVSP